MAKRKRWPNYILYFCLLFSLSEKSGLFSLSSADIPSRFYITSTGIEVRLFGRNFQPGEIVICHLHGLEKKGKAWVELGQQKHELYLTDKIKGYEFFTFFALDGRLKPGTHWLKLIIFHENRAWESHDFPLEVEKREFRQRKLNVAQEFIQPPAFLQERIERENELLLAVYSIVNPLWLGEGPFILPHPGRITAPFGDQRLYNNQMLSFHYGVDIAASWGEPVRASNSGRVVAAGNFYFSGKMVVIDHGLGLFTTYAHLSQLMVRRGEPVKKGQVIGLAGSTGLATGPHLHWGSRLGESRFDPLSLLEAGLPWPR